MFSSFYRIERRRADTGNRYSRFLFCLSFGGPATLFFTFVDTVLRFVVLAHMFSVLFFMQEYLHLFAFFSGWTLFWSLVEGAGTHCPLLLSNVLTCHVNEKCMVPGARETQTCKYRRELNRHQQQRQQQQQISATVLCCSFGICGT